MTEESAPERSAARASPRKRALTLGERPAAYILTVTITLGALCGLVYLVFEFSDSGPHWRGGWVAFGAVAILASVVAVFGYWMVSGLKDMRGVLSREPRVSVARAEAWKIVRRAVRLSAMFALLGALLCFVGAWFLCSSPSTQLSRTVRNGPAMTTTHVGSDAVGARMAMTGAGLITSSILLVLAGRWVRGRIRRAEGRCMKCAYLLHGLVEPRCPECGTGFDAGDLERGSGEGA